MISLVGLVTRRASRCISMTILMSVYHGYQEKHRGEVLGDEHGDRELPLGLSWRFLSRRIAASTAVLDTMLMSANVIGVLA